MPDTHANPAQVTSAVLEQAQGMLNAFALGREAESTLEYASAISDGEDAVQARVQDLQAELVKIKSEADDGNGGSDWSKVTSVSGTDAEKQNHVIMLSSRLNGAQKAMYEIRAEAERKEEAERREEAMEAGLALPGFAMGGGIQLPPQEELGALVERQLEARFEGLQIGTKEFKERCKAEKNFEIYSSKPTTHYTRNLMAAVFKTGSWGTESDVRAGLVAPGTARHPDCAPCCIRRDAWQKHELPRGNSGTSCGSPACGRCSCGGSRVQAGNPTVHSDYDCAPRSDYGRSA